MIRLKNSPFLLYGPVLGFLFVLGKGFLLLCYVAAFFGAVIGLVWRCLWMLHHHPLILVVIFVVGLSVGVGLAWEYRS